MAKTKTSWTAGQSGNEAGRPREMPLEVKEFLKAKTLPALRRLYKLTRNADPAIAGPALKVFLSKVIPDAKTLELSGPGGESLMKGIEPEKLTALIDYLVSAKKESK